MFEFLSSPLHGEAFTACKGLLMDMHRGLHNLILESDSLQIVTVLQKNSMDVYAIGHVVEDSKALLLGITRAIASHVRRQANEAAHRLAHYALSSPCECAWFEEPSILSMMFCCLTITLRPFRSFHVLCNPLLL